MNTKATPAICAAAVRLFMPSQTLKMPSVRVSTAKYSTAPKSDTTSISTSASPATMAGRASGMATENATLAVVQRRDLVVGGGREAERGPRHQVDIGVEHRAHHQHRAAERADLGEPVIARRGPAEQVAQARLHRPGVFRAGRYRCRR